MSGNKSNKNRLWGITSYFNPMGWKSRESNYHRFRKNLDMPLITVELAFDDNFALQDEDADILLRINDGDVMWQKERLLNLGLGALPAECDFVAWLDCDILSMTSDWPGLICDSLARHPLVQAFGTAWQTQDGRFEQAKSTRKNGSGLTSLARSMILKSVPDKLFTIHGGHTQYGYWPGYAWAARREVIERAGFYDVMIMGTGDKAIYSAAYGKISEYIGAMNMAEPLANHYRDWATEFHTLVGGNVGYADSEIQHIWHGAAQNRAYKHRYEKFSSFNFDPRYDLRLGESGAWRWGSEKPELHEHVTQYLESRKEDD